MVKNLPVMQVTGVQSLGWEYPLEKGNEYPLQCSGLENSKDCIVHGVAKSQTRLSDFHICFLLISNAFSISCICALLGGEDLLEKEMATHSSILAQKIPWMEEPGRLQSMGSQRVGHDWAFTFSHNCWLWYRSCVQVISYLCYMFVFTSELFPP